MNDNEMVYDPFELVKDLADKIGIHQLYAIAREIRGENDVEESLSPREVKELREYNKYLISENERLKGEVRALAFAVRCNSVSGNEVRFD